MRLERALGFAALALAVLALHWAGARELGAPAVRGGGAPVALEVRMLRPPAAVPATMPVALPAPPAVTRSAVEAVAPASRQRSADAEAALPARPLNAADARPSREAPLLPQGREQAAAPGSAPTPADGLELPVYPVALAPAFERHYRLRRGAFAGDGRLVWSPSGAPGRYEAHLEGRVGEAQVFDLTSRGTIDSAGIAPDRLVTRRRGREQAAVNFQRDVGRITYSGPAVEHPLPPGAQDRLTWLVQLPGVLQAAPGRFGPGSEVLLFVSGTRGDADVWRFGVVGLETVELPAVAVPALKLVREPVLPRDTRAEVWLDPVNGHLPVRLRFTYAGGAQALEMTWAGE